MEGGPRLRARQHLLPQGSCTPPLCCRAGWPHLLRGNSIADADAREGALIHPTIEALVKEADALRGRQKQICKLIAWINSAVVKRGWTDLWCGDVTAPLCPDTRHVALEVESGSDVQEQEAACAFSKVDAPSVGHLRKLMSCRVPRSVMRMSLLQQSAMVSILLTSST